MADFNFTPTYPYKGKIETSKVTINVLEDLSEVRRSQGSEIGGTYTESYTMSGAEVATLLTFFQSYQLTETFTKLTYDPMDGSYDPADVASASGPEETVRFDRPPTWTHSGPDEYRVECTFRRLPNE